MGINSYSRTKISSDAKSLVDQALAKVGSSKDKTKVRQALADVAAQNGDHFLNTTEARLVADIFESAASAAGGKLKGDSLNAALTQVGAAAQQLSESSNVDGVSAHFSFQESLETKLIGELRSAVERAAGRPLDVNIMIFEFQSDETEAALLDIARNNPNVTIRVIADSTQASPTGGNALPSILNEGLPNVQVKFKKDFPYTWNSTQARPVYNHGATSGLNHHKGFATFIDGQPDSLVTGSFNWSDTADEKNYEELVVFRAADAATRGAIAQYQDEFVGYFNNDQATLSPNNFRNFKTTMWNEMVRAHGGKASTFNPLPDDDYADYVPAASGSGFDVNGLRASDGELLSALVGKKAAGYVQRNREAYGRFASFDELLERVPSLRKLEPEKLVELKKLAQFGAGTASINGAGVEELRAAGLTAAQAQAVVDWRQAHGDFESLEALAAVPGLSAGVLEKVRERLSDDDLEAFFNSRPFGATEGGTGYGSTTSTRTTAAMGETGEVSQTRASVTVAATDLFNRAQPGQTIRVAMYGMSPGSPEYQSLIAAARRGVAGKVVLDDGAASTAAALKSLAAKGLPIEVRVQRAKTMHEKFGVVGDDVFFGSANFSTSSSTKHSEDRFAVKNNEEIARGFEQRFEQMWALSK